MCQQGSSMRWLGLPAMWAGLLCLGLAGLGGLWGCGQQNSRPEARMSSTEIATTRAPAADQDFLLEKLRKKLAKGPARFDQPQEAQELFVQKRAPLGDRRLPTEKYVTALEHMRAMEGFSTRDNRAISPRALRSEDLKQSGTLGEWTFVGPGNVGGRTRALVVHPTTPSTMYAAGVAGGVWKTVDGGATWTPLGDLMANMAVCSLAMDPTNPLVLYAGTGEGFYNIDAVRGLGIFKTTDGGATWTQIPSTNTADFHYINDLKISPNDANQVYAATKTGFFVSTNGGSSWSKTLDASSVNGCMSIAVRTDRNPDHVIIACGNFTQGTIYRSTDGGASFIPVYTEPDMGRTSLAIAPSNQDYVYALAASIGAGNYQHGLLAVLRSTNGGLEWTTRVRNTSADTLSTLLLTNPVYGMYASCWGGSNNYFYNQGWYDNVVAVDPADPDIVWAGGIDLFRSDNGGVSWQLASYWWGPTSNPHYVHADHHVIRFHPGYDGASNKTMYVGNDGGMFRTDDARAATSTEICNYNSGSMTWTNLNNGYGVTQFYYGAVYPGGGTFFGGTQDNGSPRGTLAGGPNAWSTILGGDGGAVAVDPGNVNILFGEHTGLSIKKSIDGGSSFADATTGITESSSNFLFIAPFVMDPNAGTTLWTGGWFLWRTTNGAASWAGASTVTPGNGSVSALSVAPGDSNRVAAGMSDGYVLATITALSDDSTSAWPSKQVVSGYISSLAYDPANSGTIYATCSTFGQKHVWKSPDGGVTWGFIDGSGSGALPDVPTFSIVVDPKDGNRLYVGTDLGVFVTTNGGESWAIERTGFANVITEHLVREPQTNRLYAFTHGRGTWYVPLSGTVRRSLAPIIELLLSDN